LDLAHEMPFMDPVCVIEAQDAAMVDAREMRQYKGEIVTNDDALFIGPDLLAKDADPTGTPQSSYVVGFLAKLIPSTHGEMLSQVMHITPHL
jgi:hypothetical protein